MPPLCIYHGNCADGFGAAWVVRKAHMGAVEFYPGTYQNPPPDVTGRDVILVDFSYKRQVLVEMAEKANSILILDHHKSAAEDLEGIENIRLHSDAPRCSIASIFDMNHSGAMLAWLYYFPDEAPPMLLRHIEDRDLWRFQYPDTRAVQAAVFSREYTFEEWDAMFAMPTAELCREGQALERKHFKDIREFIAGAGHRRTIAGYSVPALNAPYFWSSDAGHIMGEGELFAVCYWDTADGRVFSLRSADNGLDVAKIAAAFGGGGHQHAAGFRTTLSWDEVADMRVPL